MPLTVGACFLHVIQSPCLNGRALSGKGMASAKLKTVEVHKRTFFQAKIKKRLRHEKVPHLLVCPGRKSGLWKMDVFFIRNTSLFQMIWVVHICIYMYICRFRLFLCAKKSLIILICQSGLEDVNRHGGKMFDAWTATLLWSGWLDT